jgi:hypothetical protein
MISAQMKRARIVVRQQHLTVIENTPRDSSAVSAFQQTQYRMMVLDGRTGLGRRLINRGNQPSGKEASDTSPAKRGKRDMPFEGLLRRAAAGPKLPKAAAGFPSQDKDMERTGSVLRSSDARFFPMPYERT